MGYLYDKGITIHCKAIPLPQYVDNYQVNLYNFSSWSGLVSDESNSIQFIAKHNGQLIANFSKLKRKIEFDNCHTHNNYGTAVAVMTLLYKNKHKKYPKHERKTTSGILNKRLTASHQRHLKSG